MFKVAGLMMVLISAEMTDNEAYISKARELQDAQISQLQEMLDKVKNQKQPRAVRLPKMNEIEKQIKKAKQTLPVPVINCMAMKVGDVGVLNATKATVVKILSPNEMMVVTEKNSTVVYDVGSKLRQFDVEHAGKSVILRGLPTTEVAVGQQISVNMPCRVVSVVESSFVLSVIDRRSLIKDLARLDVSYK